MLAASMSCLIAPVQAHVPPHPQSLCASANRTVCARGTACASGTSCAMLAVLPSEFARLSSQKVITCLFHGYAFGKWLFRIRPGMRFSPLMGESMGCPG